MMVTFGTMKGWLITSVGGSQVLTVLFPVIILGTNLMRENCIKESGYALNYVQELTINE